MTRVGLLIGALWLAVSAAAQTSLFDQASEAFDAYDFDVASQLLDKYASKRKRDQIAADRVPNPYHTETEIDKVELLRDRIALASSMLDRVEKLVIIDSLTVDRNDFFRHYRLHPSSGRLVDPYETNIPDEDDALAPVFISEDESLKIWARDVDSDDGNKCEIVGIHRLADGSWTPAEVMMSRAGIFGDDDDGEGSICSPFLMADGVTLYFAADGPQSLGGLDLFVSRRDASGRFLQPSNLGMPYNSTANDYMMAIDEMTGAGWWATDRGTDEDHVKIFIFKPADLRVNFDSDTGNLAAYARLDMALEADKNLRAEMLSKINALGATRLASVSDFSFSLPDGRVMTRLTDFKNRHARELVEEWVDKSHMLEYNVGRLEALRAQYADGHRDLDAEIMDLEQRLEVDRAELRSLGNKIVANELR